MTLFVSDLDGTLLTGHGRVSEYSREKLNGLIDGGMRFSYATARSALTARQATEGLNIREPVILYNGGLIYDFTSHETVHSVLFSDAGKRYVLDVLRFYSIVPVVFGSTEPRRERVAFLAGRESEGVSRYLGRRRGDERLQAVSSEEELLFGSVFNFKCIGPRSQLESAWNDLKYDDRLICIFHPETYHDDYWMEISPRAATKANAVRILKERLGCDRVICFGDSSNDSDMFDVCDEKYAVMNADEWLKEKATGVVGYCEEDGVAKWLESNSGYSPKVR